MSRAYGLSGSELEQLDGVAIAYAVHEQLTARTAVEWDVEICAALYGGMSTRSELAVTDWRYLTNVEARASSFAVAVSDLLSQPPRPDSRLVGIFHSHTEGSAVPSDLDWVTSSYLPLVWIIGTAGGRNLRMTAYAWSKVGMCEVTVRISDDGGSCRGQRELS
jgi:proteasome lid subunit RPN8/RPN11